MYEGSFVLVSGSGEEGIHGYILGELSAGGAQVTSGMCPGGCWVPVPMGGAHQDLRDSHSLFMCCQTKAGVFSLA